MKETLVLASPRAPSIFDFPLSLDGLNYRDRTGGGFELIDRSGAIRAVIPPGYMEDSSSSPTQPDNRLSTGVRQEIIESREGLLLRVTVDRGFLDDPATVYPVRVDPGICGQGTACTTAGLPDDTYVTALVPADNSLKTTLRVGNGGIFMNRALLHFDQSDLAALAGMNIVSADLRVWQDQASTCDPSLMNVHRVTQAWVGNEAPATSWPGPTVGEVIGEVYDAKGGTGCEAGFLTADVTGAVSKWAVGEWENLGLSLRAVPEAEVNSFKRLISAQGAAGKTPELEITYGQKTEFTGNVSLTTSEVWGPEHSPYVIDGVLTVPTEHTLTLLPGTVVKFASQTSELDAFGQVLSLGTTAQPVYITSIRDDSVGGDTNGDGYRALLDPEGPRPGDWARILLRGPGSNWFEPHTSSRDDVFQHTVFRFGGAKVGDPSNCHAMVQVIRHYSSRRDARATFSESRFENYCKTAVLVDGAFGYLYGNVFDSHPDFNSLVNQGCLADNSYGGAASPCPAVYFNVTGDEDPKPLRSRLVGNKFLSPTGSNLRLNNAEIYAARNLFNRRIDLAAFYAGDFIYNQFLCPPEDSLCEHNSVYLHTVSSTGNLNHNWWGHPLSNPIDTCWIDEPWKYHPQIKKKTGWPGVCPPEDESFTNGLVEAEWYLPGLSGPPAVGLDGMAAEAARPMVGPVEAHLGELHLTEVDLSIIDAGKTVDMVRSYRSSPPGAPAVSGVMGPGWGVAYNETLSTNQGGATVTSQMGATATWAFDGDHVVPRAGNFAGYNEGSVTGVDGSALQFDANGLLTAVQARDPGRIVQVARSGALVSRVTGVSGRWVDWGYDAGKLTSWTDSQARTVGFDFNGAGRLSEVTSMGGQPTTIAYDANGRLERVTSPMGRVELSVAYDPAGRVKWFEELGRGRITVNYFPSQRYATFTDALGAVTKVHWDESGREIRREESGVRAVHSLYDGDGHVVATVENVPTRPTSGFAPTASVTWFSGNGDPVYMTDGHGYPTETSFNDAHQPQVIKSPGPNETTISTSRLYDTNGRLETYHDAAGGTWKATYDALGQVTRLADPLSPCLTDPSCPTTAAAQRWNYNSSGDLEWSENYELERTQTQVNPLGLAQRIVDPVEADKPSPAGTDIDYWPSGQIKTVTTPEGAVTRTFYNSDEQVTRIESDRGQTPGEEVSVTWFEYFACPGQSCSLPQRRVTTLEAITPIPATAPACSDARVACTEFTYDAVGRPLTHSDADGRVHMREYDALGQVTAEIAPSGSRSEITYDPAGRPSTIRYQVSGISAPCDAPGSPPGDPTWISTSMTYDRMGNPLRVTGPGQQDVEYRYDLRGRQYASLVRRSGTTYNTWTTEYDAADRIEAVRSPVYSASTGAGEQKNTYGAAGRLLSYRNDVGETTHFTHDDAHRVVAASAALPGGGFDPIWEVELDKRGNPKWYKDGEGNRTGFVYDREGRVVEQHQVRDVDPVLGELFASTYLDLDLVGNVYETTDPNNLVTTTHRDHADRIEKVVLPDQSFEEWTHSKAGLVDQWRNRAGDIWSYDYDGAGRLIEQVDPENGANHPTSWCYDDLDRVRSTTDPSGLTTYMTYNAPGQLIERWTAQNALNKDTWAYFDDGLLQQENIAGQRMTYAYNAAGDKTLDRRGNGPTTVTTYVPDAAGRVLSTTHNGVSNAFVNTYDHRGRIKTQTMTPVDNEPAQTTELIYDSADRMIGKKWPSGREDRWDWNPDGTLDKGRVGSATGPTGPFVAETSYAYDPGGRLRAATLPRGGTYEYQHAPTGEVSLERRPDGSEWSYEWEHGHLQQMEPPSSAVVSYDYDALGRLRSESVGSAQRSFEYDRAGRVERVNNADPLQDLTSAALLVVADPANLTAGDSSLRDRLVAARLAFDVTLRAATEPEDVGGADLVVIAPSGDVGAKYADVNVPVVVLREGAWVDQGLAASGTVTTSSGSSIAIESPANRIADGRFARLTGTPSVASSAGSLSAITDTGVGLDGVQVAARSASPADENVVVGYDNGALRAGGQPAPARRVAVGFEDDVLASLTAAGGDLLDNALVWARGAEPAPSGADLTVGYVNGLMTSASGPFGDVTYTWDGFGRPSSITSPGEGTTTYNWGTDGWNFLRSTTGATPLTFLYNNSGQRTEVRGTNSSWFRAKYGYDKAMRQTSAELIRSTTQSWSSTQSFELDGQVAQRTQGWIDASGASSLNDIFSYDDAGRLDGMTRGHGLDEVTVGIGFDADGNRTSLSVAGAVPGPPGSPVAPEAFGVEDNGVTTWQYDLAGKITGDSRNAVYSYEDDGRLEEVSVPNGPVESYTYDAFGALEAVDRSDGSATSRVAAWTRDGLGRPLTHTSEGGSYATFTYDGTSDRTLVHTDRDVTWGRTGHTFASDGSLAAVTTPDGGLQLAGVGLHGDLSALIGVQASAGSIPPVIRTWDPFGIPSEMGSLSTPLGFQTQHQSSTTGIVDAGARQYEPALGVFLQADSYRGNPLSPITLNRYAYANNDPITQWDPTGYWGLPSPSSVVKWAKDTGTSIYRGVRSRGQSTVSWLNKYIRKAPPAVEQRVGDAIQGVRRHGRQAVSTGLDAGRGWADRGVDTLRTAADAAPGALDAAGDYLSENKVELVALGAAAFTGGVCLAASGGTAAPMCMGAAGATHGTITGWNEHCGGSRSTGSCAVGVLTYAGLGATSGYAGTRVARPFLQLGRPGLGLATAGGVESGVSSAGHQYLTTGRIDLRRTAMDTAMGVGMGRSMHSVSQLATRARLATRAPAEMDSFTWNGSTVHHSPTATAIGDDAATMTNFGRSQGAAGHDVIVHGKVIDGQATFMTNGMPTHPQQIADAVLENPAYVRGSPVQLVTCHGACGLADDLSTALGGAPVSAVPGRVQIDPRTGLLLESKP